MNAQTSWYSIRRRTPVASAVQGVQAAAEIFIYGDIGESWWEETVSAKQFVKDIAAIDADALTIRINSYGGSVTDGIAIHNAIKRHKAKVTIAIDGCAYSIASLIAMAGDTVEMSENAMFMVHAPWGGVWGNSAQLREYADQLDKWAEAMSTSYASKTGKPAADMLALLTDGVDHFYTAAEAKEMGFVDAVVGINPEAASAMASFNLTRYRTAPAHQQTQRTSAAAAALPVASATNSQEPQMTGTVDPKGGTGNPASATANFDTKAIEATAAAAALKADGERRAGIVAAFKPHAAKPGVAELQAACEGDHAITAEAAGLKLLAHLGAGAAPIAGGIYTVADESDKQREGKIAALMLRAGRATDDQKAKASANPYRGHTLLDLARASLQAAGVRTDGMDKMQLVAAAFTQSTSDFPILLENTMHKALQSGYALQADTWTRFCAKGTVSDFRAHNRYRAGSLGNLLSLNELAEFKNQTIPDGEKGSITASTKGYIVNLSRQTVINDDLSALIVVPSNMGRAAKRTVEADVYATLALNSGMGPALADGVTLFHATHNNVGTGAALTIDGIDADDQVMSAQKDVGGNDFLDLSPQVLLVPRGLRARAIEVNGAEFNDEANKNQRRPNVVRGLFKDIVATQRLTGTRRYLFADPNVAPVLEVAFLDGNDTPYLEMEQGFTVDGSRWKVRMDYGVAGVDFRGAVTNAGA